MSERIGRAMGASLATAATLAALVMLLWELGPQSYSVLLAALALLLVVWIVMWRWGEFGLLVLVVATAWYPLWLPPLSHLVGPGIGNVPAAKLFVIAWGTVLGIMDLVRSRRQTSGLLIPLAVLVGCTLGWAGTLIEAPATRTVPEFLNLAYCLLVFVLCVRLVRSERQALVLCAVATASAVVLPGLVLLAGQVGHLPFYEAAFGYAGISGGGRLHGYFDFPFTQPLDVWGNRVSVVLASVAMVPFVFALGGRSNRERLVAIVAFLVIAVLLISTVGRAAWMALTVSCLIGVLLGLRSGAWHFSRNVTFAVLAVVVFVIGALYVSASTLDMERLRHILEPTQDPNMMNRFQIARFAIPLLIDHPLGIGFLTLQEVYGMYEHNSYLILGNGLGLLGLVLVLALMVWIASRMARLCRKGSGIARLLAIAGICGMAATLIGAFSEDAILQSAAPWAIWGSCVALAALHAARRAPGARVLDV